MTRYNVGDIVEGVVTGIENYGIFLSVGGDVSGLIHISEISDSYVRNISSYAKVNDIIYARVLEFDPVNKKLKLTIKGFNYLDGESQSNGIKETGLGFEKLSEALPRWIREKETQIKNSENEKKQ